MEIRRNYLYICMSLIKLFITDLFYSNKRRDYSVEGHARGTLESHVVDGDGHARPIRTC